MNPLHREAGKLVTDHHRPLEIKLSPHVWETFLVECAATGVQTPTPKPTMVAPEPSQTIRPAKVATRTYIDIGTEVDQYLAALKAELLAVLHAGKRIRIE